MTSELFGLFTIAALLLVRVVVPITLVLGVGTLVSRRAAAQ